MHSSPRREAVACETPRNFSADAARRTRDDGHALRLGLTHDVLLKVGCSMGSMMNHSVFAIIVRGLVSSFQLLQQSRALMDRFQEMQVFVRIAERHSFTQAADDLHMPRATVTNLMKRMEERLGARLLERTTRTVRLTLDGEAHYRRCVRLIADLEEAEGSFRHAEPKGLLRVNLQGTLARHFIMPGLPAFLERYGQIELQIGEDDRLVDLVREGVDCVLR